MTKSRDSEGASPLGPVFEDSPEAMLVLDPHADRIVDANPAASRLLGYPHPAIRGSRASALHPGQLPALTVFTQAALAKGRWWTQAITPRHADGHGLRVEYAGSPLSGEPLRLLVTLTDLEARERRRIDGQADAYMRAGLSEWQRVERIFRDIERGNQLILRAAGEGIYGVNAEGITTFINPAAERMLGWKAADLVGKDMHATVHHTHADGSHYHHRDCPIYAAFRDGAVHQVDSEVFWRSDGTPFPVEYTSTPIRDRGAAARRRDRVPGHQPAPRIRGPAEECARGGRFPARAPGVGERLPQGGDPGRRAITRASSAPRPPPRRRSGRSISSPAPTPPC